MLILPRNQVMDILKESEGFIPQVGKGAGWLPDPEDKRDYKVSSLLKTVIGNRPLSVPRKWELDNMSPIRDQGGLGACTGFAATAGVEYLRRVPDTDSFETLYSPLFSYFHGRKAIGYIHEDTGAYVRDVVKSLANVGAARERDWMYYEVYKTFKEEPSKKAYASAEAWKLGGYYRCNNLDELKWAISTGFPVVGGFLCFANIGSAQTWQTGIVPAPAGGIVGGHAVLFIGFDDDRQLVKFKNSWGPEWGDDGYGYLPYSFFTSGYATDLWVLQGESEATKPKARRARIKVPVA